MDISGLVSYDRRPRPNLSTVRRPGTMDSHLEINMNSYQQSGVAAVMPFQPTNEYSYGPVGSANYHQVLPNYTGYSQTSPSHQLPPTNAVMSHGLLGMARGRTSYHQDRPSPIVKVEEGLVYQPQVDYYQGSSNSPIDHHAEQNPSSPSDPNFSTDVDTLMRTIQANTKSNQYQPTSAPHVASPTDPRGNGNAGMGFGGNRLYLDDGSSSDTRQGEADEPRGRRRYECDQPDCGKGFCQKTHLEIHMRAHTGVKPFLCKEPSCGQRFSQLGNLKTHERRHTGERPFQCDTCGKRFAQRGNVRAHKIVHEQLKPFVCKLDDCGKQFTQLGNLKSHQNKFHAVALKHLTQKFALMREGDAVSAADKELWQYFATLYKNSNKGIKGRGKDRKISGKNSTDALHDDMRTGSPTSSQSSHSHNGAYGFQQAELDLDEESPVEPSYMQARTQIGGYGPATGVYAFADRKLY